MAGFFPAVTNAQSVAPPQGLTPAERVAVELAAAYLSEGPAAWVEKSRPGAWPQEVSQDVESLERWLGPPEGAVWRLQTQESPASRAIFHVTLGSGREELVSLEIDPGVDRPLRAVRTASSTTTRARPSREHQTASSATGEALQGVGAEPQDGASNAEGMSGHVEGSVTRGEQAGASLPRHLRVALGLLVAALALLGLSRLDSRAKKPGLLFGTLLVILSATIFLDILPLDRWGLSGKAAGGGAASGSLDTGFRRSGPGEALLKAQEALATRQLDGAESYLARAGTSQMAHLLRARLALERLDGVAAVLAWQPISQGEAAVDSVLMEMTGVLEIIGFHDRAEDLWERLTRLGSRDARVHYFLARWALAKESKSRAIEHFLHAWALQPRHRQEVLGDFLLSYLVIDTTELRDLMNLSQASEPSAPCPFRSAPVRLPEGSEARTLGGFLLVELGTSSLEIPGGCGLAPGGTRVDNAESWRQYRLQEVLAQSTDLQNRLRAHGSASPGAGADASVEPEPGPGWLPRSQLRDAVQILAEAERWQELIQLTDPAPAQAMDSDVARWRARALQIQGRKVDASQILVDLVANDLGQERVDPASLRQLAEIMVKEQDYPRALALLEKADRQVPWATSGQRHLQVQMERRLFASAAMEISPRFRLIFPDTRQYDFARDALQILEDEAHRLEPLFPPRQGPKERIDVLMLDATDFQASYGALQAAGLFDGRVRLPLGNAQLFLPDLVNLMTHEITHAMVAEATEDRAPHWFQEGLAQHAEPFQRGINPIAALLERGSYVALPLLEPIFKGSPSPALTRLAYDEVLWTLHYVEAEHGVKGIHRLLEAFRRGLPSDAAVQDALGMDMAGLDSAMRQWATTKAPQTWPSAEVEYDSLVDAFQEAIRLLTAMVEEALEEGTEGSTEDDEDYEY